ncbi:MAG: CoA transferase [Chloroflexi bacterium]|nr:CoA transferase [Chloroflexota bacterium]
MGQQALSNLTVIDLGDFVSAPYCAKLLADMGAKVIKIEDPHGGDSARRSGPFLGDVPNPERSGLFLYLNTNKVGITLNVKSRTGLNILKDLLKTADILVENGPPGKMRQLGLDYHTLWTFNPRLIMTSITPFGQTGPYRDYKSADLISFHMGGRGYTTPPQVQDITRDRPLKAGGRQADFLAGLTGATATMIAVMARRLTGRGQHVDVSEQEVVGMLMQSTTPLYTYAGRIVKRSEMVLAGAVALIPCKDGYVCLEPMLDHQWQALAEVMGNPQWAVGEMCRGRPARTRNWDAILDLMAQWAAVHTMEEISGAAQAKRVPGMPVNTVKDLLYSDQLLARGFFADIDHRATGLLRYPGSPYAFSGMSRDLVHPAPMLGQHNEEVLCGQLGWPKQELAALRRAGIV